jgi:hypothetical protein
MCFNNKKIEVKAIYIFHLIIFSELHINISRLKQIKLEVTLSLTLSSCIMRYNFLNYLFSKNVLKNIEFIIQPSYEKTDSQKKFYLNLHI